MKLVLASRSPRRRELLALLTDDFICCPSGAAEEIDNTLSPEALVQKLAREKARAVLPRYPDRLICGCDTVVADPNGNVCGIPGTRAEAADMLRRLSGKTHRVLTGVCLLTAERETVYAEETKVTFYPLTEEEIEAYLAIGEYRDKAGGYGIQGKGGLLVERLEGSYHNVVGLPVGSLARAIRAFWEEEPR